MILILCAIPDLCAFIAGACAMGPLGFFFALCWLIVFRCEGISLASFTFYSFANSGLVCLVVLHGLIELGVGLPLNLLYVLVVCLVGTNQQGKNSPPMDSSVTLQIYFLQLMLCGFYTRTAFQ